MGQTPQLCKAYRVPRPPSEVMSASSRGLSRASGASHAAPQSNIVRIAKRAFFSQLGTRVIQALQASPNATYIDSLLKSCFILLIC
jgi:hypothetical protein